MKNSKTKIIIIVALTLFGLQAIAQSSLREQFEQENGKAEPSYPAGFGEAVNDFSSTWDSIIESSDFFLILERPPKKLTANSRIGQFQLGNRLIGVWKSNDFLFVPSPGGPNFLWEDSEYQCGNRPRYLIPKAVGRVGDDGFAKFRNGFWSYLSEPVLGTPADIEVNFETLECYFRKDFGLDYEDKVTQCWVRKYNFGDTLFTNQYRITEGYLELLRRIRDTSSLLDRCQIGY